MTEGTTMPAEREAIVRIAEGLTEAQREAFKNNFWRWTKRIRPKFYGLINRYNEKES